MFPKIHLLCLFVGLACCTSLLAQETPPPDEPAPAEDARTGDSPGPARFWQADLAGGSFMVALDRIASISRHQYVLDGALIIDEVTIDTVGQALTRFYFITPITDAAAATSLTGIANRGRELVDKAAQRAGTEVQNMVVKKYPDTSHAKSIEYRVLSERDLTALYASVRNAWESGRGRQFRAR
jgi:hypothetical protein